MPADTLNAQLDGWLALVQPGALDGFNPPIPGCKAVIAPHAGYSYSGPAAAWAYKSIDTTGIKTVFILGPSHHVYLDGCALSKCVSYETPVGSLPLDLDIIAELRKTEQFSDMSLRTDEDEHSIEMHLPYVRKVFQGLDIKIVPILVGAIKKDTEAYFGALLAPYLAKPDTICVVSSDFCHWGTRFSYTFYYPSPPPSSTPPVKLSRSVKPNSEHPIHQSITALDKAALDILTLPSLAPDVKTAAQTHEAFANYLHETRNTICGRHPIGVLLGALAEVEKLGNRDKEMTIKWVRYEQSSACVDIKDSSVSYASAYVEF
ncbi:AmmeMemoRadiSam system protein B [Ceratobasidium sp. AG-Ba]|nr:AmmeMemoRadiSam system protein B [Ceratobasidium sp. AG-Ba]